MTGKRRGLTRSFLLLLAELLFGLATFSAFAAGTEVAFDAANRLYEEGKYSAAATAYEQLLADGHRSASIYFNLGTAYYKAGERGRAIAAYLRAERLTPRDEDLRANLRFIRKKVNGDDRSPVPFWRSWFLYFTLNEGTVLAAAAFWIWILLLAAREFRPAWRKPLRSYALGAGVLTLLLASGLAAAACVRQADGPAVVVVKEAVVRFGPLDESEMAYQLPDGAEVTVLDHKDNWLQIRNRANRIGWVKRDQVIVLSDAPRSAAATGKS